MRPAFLPRRTIPVRATAWVITTAMVCNQLEIPDAIDALALNFESSATDQDGSHLSCRLHDESAVTMSHMVLTAG